MSNIVGEVNCRVIELIEEIISSSNRKLFVTVPMVLTELLARYSVNGLDELGISLADVPALKFLKSINQKVGFCKSFLFLLHIIFSFYRA